MKDNIVPFAITVINISLLVILVSLLVYNFRKCFLLPLPVKDHIFYSLKLKKTIVYFLANVTAFWVNIQLFYNPSIYIPMDLTWLRYVDRCSMLILAILMVLDSMKYSPSAYDNLEKSKA